MYSPVSIRYTHKFYEKADLSVCVVDKLWKEDMIRWKIEEADGSGPRSFVAQGNESTIGRFLIILLSPSQSQTPSGILTIIRSLGVHHLQL